MEIWLDSIEMIAARHEEDIFAALLWKDEQKPLEI